MGWRGVRSGGVGTVQKSTRRPRRGFLADPGSLHTLEARRLLAVTTFTVTNTDDSGPGSLRQAMDDANAHPNGDTFTNTLTDGDVDSAANGHADRAAAECGNGRAADCNPKPFAPFARSASPCNSRSSRAN